MALSPAEIGTIALKMLDLSGRFCVQEPLCHKRGDGHVMAAGCAIYADERYAQGHVFCHVAERNPPMNVK